MFSQLTFLQKQLHIRSFNSCNHNLGSSEGILDRGRNNRPYPSPSATYPDDTSKIDWDIDPSSLSFFASDDPLISQNMADSQTPRSSLEKLKSHFQIGGGPRKIFTSPFKRHKGIQKSKITVIRNSAQNSVGVVSSNQGGSDLCGRRQRGFSAYFDPNPDTVEEQILVSHGLDAQQRRQPRGRLTRSHRQGEDSSRNLPPPRRLQLGAAQSTTNISTLPAGGVRSGHHEGPV